MNFLPRLTLCMITRDEAELLPRCLESVRGVVDEIVVVDTGSLDATCDIARSYGAIVSTFDWCDDFAAARNASLALASGEWILVMDADEVMTQGAHAHLRTAIQGPHGAYTLELENLTDDQERQALRLLRLFRNHPAIRYEGRVHEQVTASLERLGLSIGMCEARLLHDGYLSARMTLRSKHKRNLSLLETMHAEDARNPYVAYHLGKTLMAMERWVEAKEAFGHALDLLATECHPEHVPYYPSLFLLQAALAERLHGLAAAYALIDQGTQRLPTAAKLWLEAGRLLGRLGRLEEGLVAFARSFDLSEFDTAPEVARIPERAATGAAETLMAMGRNSEAIDCLEQATEFASEGFAPWLRLGVALMQAGRFAEARKAFEEVITRQPQEASAQMALATLYFEAGEFVSALNTLQALDAATPGRADIAALRDECLRRLS